MTDAESNPFLLSFSLGLSDCFCCSLATSTWWWLEHSLGTWKLNLSRWERTIGSISPMFFRNALTANLLCTKQLLSALPWSRFYKMWYETLFCLSRSFKLVPLAVTSGYILLLILLLKTNTDGNLQIKALRLRVIRRIYSSITLAPAFFFLLWDGSFLMSKL